MAFFLRGYETPFYNLLEMVPFLKVRLVISTTHFIRLIAFLSISRLYLKGAIFEKLRFSIIHLTVKKWPKQDEFGILG
jgi:hypothetical protein